jgi:aminopeptidase C
MGASRFSQGGLFTDPMFVLKNYGMAPDEVMNGLQYGEDMHVHGEMNALLQAYMETLVKNPNGKLSTAWLKGYQGILEAYLGAIPKQFTYQGQSFTPQSFATSLGINPDDYLYFTSFSHHPFYRYFQLAVPDNWMWASYYNLPLDDFVNLIDNAINAGYTVAWDADVSERGFTRNGIATVPDVNFAEMSGSDQARWMGLSQAERDAQLLKIEGPAYEKAITQENRQEAFANYQTTEDHLMLIFGIAKDQKGNKYYMVKNSWGTNSKYNGIWYVSEAYVRYKTITLMMHKNAVPAAVTRQM